MTDLALDKQRSSPTASPESVHYKYGWLDQKRHQFKSEGMRVRIKKLSRRPGVRIEFRVNKNDSLQLHQARGVLEGVARRLSEAILVGSSSRTSGRMIPATPTPL